MAQGEGFKHITVTAAEDEDVVIHAGLPVESMPAEQEGGTIQKSASQSTSEEAKGESPEEASHEEAREERKARQQRSDEGYRETTLEDLESSPMPLTQKVVIIAAIVCIIGALVYYFAFMR